jgi:hypothetical protein
MVQSSEDFCLALEPKETFSIAGEGRRQDFDGDLAFEVCVYGAIDLTHAARAEQRGDLIGAEARARSKRHL